MKINTFILVGILIAVAAPGGYFIYKDVQLEKCLEDLASGYGNRLDKLGRCSHLGATKNQLEIASSLHNKRK
jgi:hypothetical protein